MTPEEALPADDEGLWAGGLREVEPPLDEVVGDVAGDEVWVVDTDDE